MKIVLAAYGSRGDVEPCVAVARELHGRAHDVVVAVPPDKLAVAESAGVAAVAYGPDSREQITMATSFVRNVQNPMSALPQLIERVTTVWTGKSETLTSLAEGADLLVAGMNEQRLAANVAERLSIPLAALHFFPAGVLELGRLQSDVTSAAERVQRRVLGLPDGAGSSTRPALEIQAYDELCAPELAQQWAESGCRRPFVGSLTLGTPTDADDEVLSWIAEGTPPIYFGFGSTPITSPAETVAVISAACAQIGERALICSGPNDFTHIPPAGHVKVVEAVNHAAVFPACRAIVHHGGAGTTAAGMRAGVPMLILWLWLDQPIWAEAVSRLEVGAGRAFSASTLDSLVADLRSVRSAHHLSRAREVAARMTTSSESVAAAADLLEGAARPA
ncbi:putative glycosyltransferase [Mycobacterium mantenii]|uniref:Glycosyltransferase n=1 Tax=Mycobacterium mantenii TaxID=560555 RepID=A0A1X0G5D7_MYCNT|nr:glycosyltransferase [Mycobacterium mantenii]MCV7242080.1 glycosyltransferase [Mycobacterium mantenii]ORB09236.1 glycosyltransferase [Mycobacterium mantenii]BBY37197.1 putative glycosyltransferase [Mycobacterium mantenii]